MVVSRVVSGGQTGVDRAGLDVMDRKLLGAMLEKFGGDNHLDISKAYASYHKRVK